MKIIKFKNNAELTGWITSNSTSVKSLMRILNQYFKTNIKDTKDLFHYLVDCNLYKFGGRWEKYSDNIVWYTRGHYIAFSGRLTFIDDIPLKCYKCINASLCY